MRAVQIMTGGGGWPLSVFLTPDLKPFYGGTYYPPRDAFGRPGFLTVLQGIARAWTERREELLQNADELIGYVARSDRTNPSQAAPGPADPDAALIDRAADALRETFDPVHGGFGSAPKFPSAPAVELLLRAAVRTRDPDLLHAAEFTLERMACGGLYDQIGGGFHRYSVDERWLTPHFEKMLYDNAQLAQVYCLAHQVAPKPLYARIARETLDYLLRDMRDPAGGFHSAEDADSEGEEGRYYLWSAKEIHDALGVSDGALVAAYYGVAPEGNFRSHEPYHRGRNILHLPFAPDAAADQLGVAEDVLLARIEECKQRLRAVRERRVRPGRDDKVLTSWNALAISALARGYQTLGDPRYRDAANEAADFILTKLQRDGMLLRSYRDGDARLLGYLDDYAFLLVAIIDLYETTFDPRRIDQADELARQMRARFHDDADGGFFLTSAEHTDTPVRMKPLFDGAEPSGNSMAAHGLLRLARLTGKSAYAEAAERILRLAAEQIAAAPRGFLSLLCALDFAVHPPKEIALVGPADAPETAALLDVVRARFLPNRAIAWYDPDAPDADAVAARIPLLAGKTLRNGTPAAYVCKDYACKEPVSDPAALAALLEPPYD